ncbi:MAG: carboxypeptidase-like regulatory domain-containing protein [Candidatus Riflebacteria bacterium]|nr:carboxypeptidase-like regulatory domain-containing protein [Candidatus Riflebacteria bacterium]
MKILARLRRLRISRTALKRRFAPALVTFMFAVLVFMPAYRFDSQDNHLTRFELAQMFETVLESCRIEAQPDCIPQYIDLDDDQLFGVYRTLSGNIIKGYSDCRFRPEEPLRNIEAVGYIQKLILFLRQTRPESEVNRQLLRIMAYQNSPGEIMAGAGSSFMPEQFANLANFTNKDVMANLIQAVIGQPRSNSLRGKIINALTGEPLVQAYVASERIAVVTDELGAFRIDYPDQYLDEVLIMAVAENFEPVELKKNIKFNQNVILRLRPKK